MTTVPTKGVYKGSGCIVNNDTNFYQLTQHLHCVTHDAEWKIFQLARGVVMEIIKANYDCPHFAFEARLRSEVR